jgi:hypothetical protein
LIGDDGKILCGGKITVHLGAALIGMVRKILTGLLMVFDRERDDSAFIPFL